jgi:hypothetical protein
LVASAALEEHGVRLELEIIPSAAIGIGQIHLCSNPAGDHCETNKPANKYEMRLERQHTGLCGASFVDRATRTRDGKPPFIQFDEDIVFHAFSAKHMAACLNNHSFIVGFIF